MEKVVSFIRIHLQTILVVFFGGIAVLAWLYPHNTQKRDFSFTVQQSTELVASSEKIKKDSIEFLYEGQKVPNLISLKLRFQNSGSIPLEEKDFFDGITVSLPVDSRIVSQSIRQVQPLREATLFQQSFLNRISENKVVFKPILINSGEIFDLDILATRQGVDNQDLSYKNEDLKLDYKILGVSQINHLQQIQTNSERQLFAQQRIRELFESMKAVGMIFGIIVILFALLIGVSKKFPPKKTIVKGEADQKKTGEKLLVIFFLILIFGGIPLLIIWNLYKIINDAWFLQI